MQDLDSDYETYERAIASFGEIPTVEGRKYLYDHAKAAFEETESRVATVRDKAKVMLGSTAFFLALLSAPIALIQYWHPTLPIVVTILLLFAFAWVGAHFWRSLILSMQAITRDESIQPSTQEVCRALTATKLDFDNGRPYVHLAAQLRSAATQTNRTLLRRVNRVILAQTSFRWGLRLLPILFLSYVVALLLFARPKASSDADAEQAEQTKRMIAAELLTSERNLRRELQASREEHDARLREETKTIDSLKTEHSALKTRVNASELEFKDLKLELATTNEETRRRHEKLESESRAATGELEERLSRLAEEIDSFKNRIKSLEGKNESVPKPKSDVAPPEKSP